MFGLGPEWLLTDGKPIAEAMVLSHPEQLNRLRATCPEAVPTAVQGGDPCYDRLLAARPYRDRFRRALDVRQGQRLVLLNSTWNPESLFGDGGEDILATLLPALTRELPADEYRLAAVLHPNIWHGHGPGQIRMWLDRARRAGLALVEPVHDWRQAVLAADVVVGDFGSVSYYAAALGTPVLLGATHLAGLGNDSPVASFVREAPKYRPHAPLKPQLETVISDHRPLTGPATLTTSAPGQSAALLRRVFYRMMGLPEPQEPALLEPLRLPAHFPAERTVPLTVLTRVREAGEVQVARYAEPLRTPAEPGESHTVVHEDALDASRLSLADVIVRYGTPGDPRLGPSGVWAADVLERHPSCSLAAYVTGPGSCIALLRGGTPLVLSADPWSADPAAYASALHAWTASGREVAELHGVLTVVTGRTAQRVSVRPADSTELTGQP